MVSRVLLDFRKVLSALTVVLMATSLSTCKARKGGSSLQNAGSEYYSGPNMSGCAESPATCRCVLDNEFDTENKMAPPPGSDPEKVKQWFSQCIGQETWYKASGGSGRFHAYFQNQKLNAVPDWGLIFHAEARDSRFQHWGTVNDPSCCTPGKNCQGKFIKYPDGTQKEVTSLDDTFGWEFCPGDETLLGYVGSGKDYTESDPACAYNQLSAKVKEVYNVDLAVSPKSCHLAFGTSSGAVGIRKFPNPRFSKDNWTKVNGDLASWTNFSRRQPGTGDIDNNAYNAATPRGAKSRVDDASVEPPFMIGEACGTCHVGFNPVRPPENPSEPKWDNILFAIGNIYIRFTDMLAAGTKPGSLEREVFVHGRPGTVDTSAITNDYANGAGTFNAIINTDQRPGIVASADDGSGFGAGVNAPTERFCESSPQYPRLGFEKECGGGGGKKKVPHILKGGEDSVGPAGAVQRVYFNIFSCTETCLGNHLDDPRALSGRGSRQTPLDLEQCTRDCPSVGAVFDRIPDIYAFLLKVRPNDLKDHPEGKKKIEDSLGAIADVNANPGIKRGADIYAKNCARCHSSFPGQSNEQVGTFANGVIVEPDTDVTSRILLEDLAKPKTQPRRDWLGSDVRVPVRLKDLGTNYCRALHTNHMQGHLWDVYGSAENRAPEKYAGYSPGDFEFPKEGLSSDKLGGPAGLFTTLQGRGFYRNISLLNVWAHAPFLHNNAVGYDFNNGLPQFQLTSQINSQLLPPDPSISGRVTMFEKSMEQLLLSPEKRNGGKPKVEVTASPITLVLAPALPEQITSISLLGNFLKTPDGKPLAINLPAGMPLSIIGSLRHKKLVADFIKAASTGGSFLTRMSNARAFLAKFSVANPQAVIAALIQGEYVNCTDMVEDAGHSFGANLSDEDKKALVEFMKLL